MNVPVERDLLAEFAGAVAAYLNVTAALADCLEHTLPEVGGPYRQRIHRVRSRVAFDATREVIKDSAKTLEAELKDYASVANRVLAHRTVELKSGILALGDSIENLAQRQELFGHRLRHFAAQMEKTPYPADAQSFSDAAALQAAALIDLVEQMSGEAASVVTQMRQYTIELGQRLASTASTDPVTGLMNRRELERQIDAHRLHARPFSLVLFELRGPLSKQVLRMAAAKLVMKFRPTDWIGRWGEKQIAVLFLGEQKLAEIRTAQVVSSLEGRYTLDNGETVLIAAEARLLQPELATA